MFTVCVRVRVGKHNTVRVYFSESRANVSVSFGRKKIRKLSRGYQLSVSTLKEMKNIFNYLKAASHFVSLCRVLFASFMWSVALYTSVSCFFLLFIRNSCQTLSSSWVEPPGQTFARELWVSFPDSP